MYVIVLLFFLVIMLYIALADIFTILFRLTGLTEERARFQVISLLTNSGFTTNESETVLETRIRRKLAKTIMIFGYTFTATIVSSVVSILLSMNSFALRQTLAYLLIVAGAFTLFMLLRGRKFFTVAFDRLINRFYCKYIVKEQINPVMLVEDYGQSVIANVFVNRVPQALAGKRLSESGMRGRWELLVLMIKSPRGEIRHGQADSVISEGDVVTVMGRRSDIDDCFNAK